MIEQDKKELKSILQEISNSMARMDGEKDYIKEAIKSASDKFNINKKILKKMAVVYHRNSFTDEISQAEEFQTMYESVLTGVL